MATINCPDCGGTVSELAEKCPHCARPSPGLSAPQLQSQAKEGEAKKAAEERSQVYGCLMLAWLGNAFLALVAKGLPSGVVALFFGPFVWLIR